MPLRDLDATGNGSPPGGLGGAGGEPFCELDLTAPGRVGEGSLAFEAEAPDRVVSAGAVEWQTEQQADARGGSWLVARTEALFSDLSSPCAAPRADYRIDLAVAGTYALWVKGNGRQEGGAVRVGIDGVGADAEMLLAAETDDWVGATSAGSPARLRVAAPGFHTVHFWLASGTPALDQVYLTLDEGILPLLSTQFVASPTTERPLFQFDTAGDAEGWIEGETAEAKPPEVKAGTLTALPVSGRIVLSRAGLAVDADALSVLEIVGTFPPGVSVTVFFAREGQAFFATDSAASPQVTVDGEQTILVDLGNDADYAGVINSLRLQLSDVAGKVGVDSIRFVAPSVRGVDPDCVTGIENVSNNACCPLACGVCGGGGCGQGVLGPELCCAAEVLANPPCASAEPPCGFPR